MALIIIIVFVDDGDYNNSNYINKNYNNNNFNHYILQSVEIVAINTA